MGDLGRDLVGDDPKPVVVDVPLRGERWVAVTSPGDRIPSHGTDQLGQRFAYDLIKVDERPGLQFHPLAGTLRGNLLGGATRDCYAWGAPVHAPFDGEVVRAVDGIGERGWIHPLHSVALAVFNALTFRPSRLNAAVGNHVVLRKRHGRQVHAVFAHLAPGSVSVAVGDEVRTGHVIGRVGHTGNSTSAHLHFQLMDGADPLTARGVPCAFRSYEVLRGATWEPVRNGIPTSAERLRFVDGP